MTDVEDSIRLVCVDLFRSRSRVPTRQLVELGWRDLYADDPAAAVSVVCEEQGRRLGSSQVVELIMMDALRQTEGLAAADSLALILPVRALAAASTGSPGVDGLSAADIEAVSHWLVPVQAQSAIELWRVPAAGLVTTKLGGIDPDAGWLRVRGRDLDLSHVETCDGMGWPAALALGHLAMCHESIGVTSAMLALAVDHVSEREQFGVLIGSFQAVQHRLAEVHVAVEAAKALARCAWVARDPMLCAGALGAAREAFDLAREHCQQVLGAIGYTWDHDLHRYIRRGVLLGMVSSPISVAREGVRSTLASSPSEVLC